MTVSVDNATPARVQREKSNQIFRVEILEK
jgi:hypothetical protein